MQKKKIPAAVGLGLGILLAASAMWAVPAIADDDHESDHSSQEPTAAPTAEPTIQPEPEPEGEVVKVTRGMLEQIERDIDPVGTKFAYVCANEGDEDYTVVLAKAAPPNAKVDPNAAPVQSGDIAPLDPCIGKSLVVGKGPR